MEDALALSTRLWIRQRAEVDHCNRILKNFLASLSVFHSLRLSVCQKAAVILPRVASSSSFFPKRDRRDWCASGCVVGFRFNSKRRSPTRLESADFRMNEVSNAQFLKTVQWRLLGSWEASVEEKRVSSARPAGNQPALNGHHSTLESHDAHYLPWIPLWNGQKHREKKIRRVPLSAGGCAYVNNRRRKDEINSRRIQHSKGFSCKINPIWAMFCCVLFCCGTPDILFVIMALWNFHCVGIQSARSFLFSFNG